jgi:hypothetical protein
MGNLIVRNVKRVRIALRTRYGIINPVRMANVPEETDDFSAVHWLSENVAPMYHSMIARFTYGGEHQTQAWEYLADKLRNCVSDVDLDVVGRMVYCASADLSWQHFIIDYLDGNAPSIKYLIYVKDDMLALQLKLTLAV